MPSPIEFPVEGSTVRGRLWSPDATGPTAGIVMAPGFTATSHFAIFESYARGLAAAGVAVLLFDVRGFGSSDGEPRHEIDPWAQVRDYHGAIAALRATSNVDPDRVGVWGVSLSGAIATVAAATDPRVAAVVLLVPAFGDEASAPDPGDSRFDAIRHTVLDADLGSYARTSSEPMPVVSPSQLGTPSLLQPLSAFHWFIESGSRFGTRWENQATIGRTDTPTPFEAQVCVPHIAAPTIMVIAEEDEMEGADADVAREVFTRGPDRKSLVTVGGGHFGVLYDGSPDFETSLAAQQAFVREHLQ